MYEQAGRERRRASLRRDSGVTFVEILITIVLLGTVVIGILTAVRATVMASSKSREAAQIETALVNVADRINRAPMGCDYTVHVRKAVEAQGWGDATVAVTHEYYHPGAPGADAQGWISNPPGTPNQGCPVGSASVPQFIDPARPALQFVQRVTAGITSPSGDVSREIQVVKSNV